MDAVMREIEELKQREAQWRDLAMRNAPPPQNQYQTYEPAPQRASSFQEPAYPSAQLMMENPQEYDRQMQAYIQHTNQQAVSYAAQQISPQLADAGRLASQFDPELRDVWEKFPHEIEQEMVRNNIPPQARNKQAWDIVAKIVRGNRYRELGQDHWSRQQAATGTGTETATNTGGAPAVNQDGLAAFWASDHPWVIKAKNNGMTTGDVRKYISAQGISEEKWVEDMTKGRSFSAEAA